MKIAIVVLVATMSLGCNRESAPSCDTAEAAAAIRRADLAMAEAVAARDRDRFMTFVASDGVFFGAGGARGPEQIAGAWAPLQPDGPALAWRPEEAVVSAACDLGYTSGPYEIERGADDGTVEMATGTYVTIWRREADEAWRVVVDIGTPPAAP